MSQQSNRKRVLWILGCGTAALVLVLAGAWVLWGWQEAKLPPAPKVPPKSQTKDVASVSAPAPAKHNGSAPASAPKEAQASEVPPFTVDADTVPKAGNLGKMTSLRGNLEEVRLQVAIAQEKEKLLPKQAAPAPQPQMLLPELPKPVVAKPKEAAPVVVSIQGVDGHASATIRSSAGSLVTVRPGDKFGGGVIASVSRNGVLVRRGNALTALALE